MKKSTKAALLSALIAPGLGHISLKKYFLGFVLLSVSGLSLFHIISKSIETALQVLEKVQLGVVAPDANSVMALVRQQTVAAEGAHINEATLVLVLCWIIAVIDSYRLGRSLDNRAQAQHDSI